MKHFCGTKLRKFGYLNVCEGDYTLRWTNLGTRGVPKKPKKPKKVAYFFL
jgi:hypothetical protein